MSSTRSATPTATEPQVVPVDRPLVTTDEVRSRADRPAHVLGAVTAEGVAVARLLVRLGFTQVLLHDTRARDVLRPAFRQTHGAFSRRQQDDLWDKLRPLLDGGRYESAALTGIEPGDTLVLGQGWYLDADVRRRARAAADAVGPGGLVTSMTELYAAFVRGPIAGVTGTNGKSTTVALIDHLLTAGDVAHELAGNERSNRQFLPDVLEVPADRPALLEVSNRQLVQLTWSPRVAAITSLTPDHLEEHGGLAGYVAAKERLFRYQSAGDIAIASADDAAALAAAMTSPAAAAGRLVRCGIDVSHRDAGGAVVGESVHAAPSVRWVSSGDPDADGAGLRLVADAVPTVAGTTVTGELATREDFALVGSHNLRNAAVAVAVALALGAPPSAIAPGLRSFAGKSLRFEHVGRTPAGVDVYSDVKATSPESTMAALEALSGRDVHLVAGGDDKGLDYAPLAAAITRDGVRLLLVPGTASDLLAAELDRLGTTFTRVEELAEALDRGFEGSAPGSAVIVSPAAAGFWTRQLAGRATLRSLLRDRGVASDTTLTAGAEPTS